jgi:hypothetical protein
MTSGEQDSSAEAKRAVSTTRVRDFRKRQKLGLLVRTIRISPKQVTKLTTLGYLDFGSRGDEKAEGIAIEAYLGDSLWGNDNIVAAISIAPKLKTSSNRHAARTHNADHICSEAHQSIYRNPGQRSAKRQYAVAQPCAVCCFAVSAAWDQPRLSPYR